jgi:hypothetical protein
LKEKELIKEMEKDKRNTAKEKKKMDHQIQKEKIKSVRFFLLKEEQCTSKILCNVMLEMLILKYIHIWFWMVLATLMHVTSCVIFKSRLMYWYCNEIL